MYTVIDIETTGRSPVGFPANPMWMGNFPVAIGYKHYIDSSVSIVDRRETSGSLVDDCRALASTTNMLVGHNIKFDLLYLLNDIKRGKGMTTALHILNKLPPIWDTQLAEYLLSGQTHMYPSLDECATAYGGTVKSTIVKVAFDAGKYADEIPTHVLHPYLADDVTNTELVFLGQFSKAKSRGMLPLIQTQMEALRATTIMQFHGMHLDLSYTSTQIDVLKDKVALSEKMWVRDISSLQAVGVLEPTYNYQITSAKDVSAVFFGKDHKRTVREHVGLYKNGKDKYKNRKVVQYYSGLGLSTVGMERNKVGNYTVDTNVLENIYQGKHKSAKGGTPNPMASGLARIVLQYREFHKKLNTYYLNLEALCINGFVHPSLLHVSTKTGRLSCKDPNLQNQTSEGGIKKAFTSRFGNGALIELDYSQLEMVALAVLSNDEQLIKDITDGVDMHSELYFKMYGRYPTKEERKPFKRLSFGLIYGAGARSLAENAGCTVAEAKRFITVFYSRYAGVSSYHMSLLPNAVADSVLTPMHDTEAGLPVHEYVRASLTGRRYVFREYANKNFSGRYVMGYSQPELKNWPVQGFATGDIVPMMVGLLVRKLNEHKHYSDVVLPIMTVHDSIPLDCADRTIVQDVAAFCKEVLESAPTVLKSKFGIDFKVPLKVEAASGTNWLDQSPIVFS